MPEPPLSSEEAARGELERGPDISGLPDVDPLPDELTGPALLQCGGPLRAADLAADDRPGDYDRIDTGDGLRQTGLHNTTKGETYQVRHRLSDGRPRTVLAGGTFASGEYPPTPLGLLRPPGGSWTRWRHTGSARTRSIRRHRSHSGRPTRGRERVHPLQLL